MERLRSKWNCHDFQHFINGIKKENPRHIAKQLSAVERFLDAEKPDKALVAEVMKECCAHFRYQFSQFKTVYDFVKAGRSLPSTSGVQQSLNMESVQYKTMDVYNKAFQTRVQRTEREVLV